MIIDKWDSRILDVIDAGIEFMLETDIILLTNSNSIDSYKDKLLDDLYIVFSNSTSDIIVSYTEDNILAGFAIVHKDTLFNMSPIGILNKFYIRKSYRGTDHGRKLTQMCVDWFDSNDVVDSFATSTAGIGEGKQFENLFKKYGFAVIGACMRRTHV